jgi:hypothetical protein
MSNKPRINDLVIILPGISGSVLQKDGKDLWANSGSAVFRFLRNLGKDLERMHVVDDDPQRSVLGDGIEATRVLSDTHIIPGLWKIDGYTAISKLITDNFEVLPGKIGDPTAGNFFEFPYDWRRDNRSSAHRLRELINEKLPAWRKYTNKPDAKVILLAHSMGGLVSRYWLEALEGWPDCRALVTFGTPHRGSLDAVGTLSNGFKKAFLDLTDAMRTFPSVHQLMPRYPAVKVGDEWKYPKDVDLPGIDRAMAEDAFAFHKEIEDAVERHRTDASYLSEGYTLIPVVGVRQKTNQSAVLENGKVSVHRAVPDYFEAYQEGGDGTVPRVSAVPIEMSDEYRETFIAERHSSLQASRTILGDLRERIKQMQSTGLGNIRGPEIKANAAEGPAISLDLDDLYLEDEPVALSAELVNVNGDGPGLVARITGVDTGQPTQEFELSERANGWAIDLEGLKPGLHRIEVATVTSGPNDPHPVHDVFEVMG